MYEHLLLPDRFAWKFSKIGNGRVPGCFIGRYNMLSTNVLLFSFTPTSKSKGTSMLAHWEVILRDGKSKLLIIFFADSDDIFVTLEMWNGSYYFDKTKLPNLWQNVFSYQKENEKNH